MMQEDYNIIAKYFAGEELSDDEKAIIKRAKADPVFWTDMEALTRNSKRALNFKHFHLDKAWERVDSKTNTNHYRTRSISNWLKYAATIAILVATSLIVWQIAVPDRYITYHTDSYDLSRPAYVLPDGSKVTLNHGSTLKVPRKFSNNIRAVKLEGEAFFEVAPDANHPFLVNAGIANIKVLGTSFNVRSDTKKRNVEVAVESGRVEVAGMINKNASPKVVLAKNQKGIVSNGKVIKLDDYNKNDLAWFTRRIEFESAPLAEVVDVLSHTYHTNITIEAGVDTSQMITASFDRQNISYVLDVIAMTLNLNVNQHDSNMFSIVNNQVKFKKEQP